MKHFIFLTACTIIFGFQANAHSAQVPPLRYVTEESAPDNFTEKGVLKGASVEVLQEIWKILGVKSQSIEVLPWARAYREAQDIPNTVLFSIIRNVEREALFKWVGPIRTSRFVLVAHRKTKIWLSSPAELQNYRIGTVIDDINEKLLGDYGIPLSRLDRAPSSTQNLEKFKKGRFDLLPFSETGISTALKSQGMNPQNYRVVFTLSEKPIYFAFHKEIPDAVVRKFQQALDTLRRNGGLNRILKKYDIMPLADSH